MSIHDQWSAGQADWGRIHVCVSCDFKTTLSSITIVRQGRRSLTLGLVVRKQYLRMGLIRQVLECYDIFLHLLVYPDKCLISLQHFGSVISQIIAIKQCVIYPTLCSLVYQSDGCHNYLKSCSLYLRDASPPLIFPIHIDYV